MRLVAYGTILVPCTTNACAYIAELHEHVSESVQHITFLFAWTADGR